jgi:glycosyltransferase involved in cell wall biosynthesis
MKIAVVSGHYTPELGYQEVYLARAFTRLGHQVKVFTSTAVSPTARRIVRGAYPAGLAQDRRYGYEIERLPATLSFSANVLCRGLRKRVLEYRPDAVVIIGLAKLFGGSLLCTAVSSRSAIITVFGDAHDYVDTSTPLRRLRFFLQRMFFWLLKRPLYRKAASESRRVVFNHAEAGAIVRGHLGPRQQAVLGRKALEATLGYDPDEFFFREADRQAMRAKLGIGPDEVALVTCSRVNRRKNLERVIELVAGLAERGQRVRYIIAGFLGDAYESELKSFIQARSQTGIFICMPFLSHEETRQIYCAADIGIWPKAAISIQEAMGTGLAVLLEEREIVGHLVEPGVNGWYYPAASCERTLEQAVAELAKEDSAQRAARRRHALEFNRSRLSYDSVAERIIAQLQSVS